MNPKEKTAREYIKAKYGTPEGEYGPTAFVEHHLEELEPEYWHDLLGTATPEPHAVLDALVLVNLWSSKENGINDTYDFSLPHKVTDYVVMVRFEGDKIIALEMES